VIPHLRHAVETVDLLREREGDDGTEEGDHA
jgi:hypothetical protein